MVMAAVMMTAGMQVARAQLIDPTTGVMVDPATDPADFSAVAGGQPGNIGMELAAQASEQAQQAAQAAMEQAAQAAQDAANAANASQPSDAGSQQSSPPAKPTVAKPAVSPKGGTFHVAAGAAVQVTLRDKDPKAKLHYTTDGTTPTVHSAVYAGPIAVRGDETIKVLASRKGENSSAVVTTKYKVEN